MKQYQTNVNGSFVIDGLNIPNTPGNRHYKKMQQEVADGLAEILPYVEPPPQVPPSVSRFQARAALHNAGLLEAVQAVIDDPETDPITKLAWEDAQTFERASPTIAALAIILSLNDADLDNLFFAAAEISA